MKIKGFRKLKMAVRLIAAFLVIAIFTAGLGIYAIISYSSAQTLSEAVINGHGQSQANMGFIRSSLYEQQSLINKILADRNAVRTKADIEAIAIADKEMTDALNAMIATYQEGEVPPATANVANSMKEYQAMRDEAVKMVSTGDYDKAYVFLHNEGNAALVTQLSNSIDEMFNADNEFTVVMLKGMTATADQTIIIMIVIVAAAVVAAILLGILMARSVSKPLRNISAQLEKVANGDDLDTVDEQKFKGEFISMARSFNEVRASLYRLLDDTGMLANAAIEGELSVRADASKHKGGYRRMVDGVNRTLDSVIEPVNEAAAVLGELAKGNLGVAMEGDYKGDHAVIKDALNETIGSLKGYITEISDVLGGIALGDLSLNIKSDFKGDFIQLKESINSISDSLSRVMSEINIAAGQVASGTRQVSEGSQAISQGATEQASAIEQLTATVTEIAEQTKSNAISAGKANELAVNAKTGAAQGSEQMKAMQNAMEEINESSANISKIIKVIDDIAFQTNILALNAAVEAARAGVHGKGFAVVAEEVRNLAARSANAAKETTALIEGSIKKTEAGTDIANKTAQALAAIVEGVDKAAELTGQIAVASDEQATGITQVNNGIEQLSTVVQTNSATSEETAASAEELSSQAEMLKNMVGRFKIKQEAKAQPAAKPEPKVKEVPAQAKPRIALSDGEFGKY